jgi:hypothetical protein
MIVGDQDADVAGHVPIRTVTVVPRPGAESIVCVPPSI